MNGCRALSAWNDWNALCRSGILSYLLDARAQANVLCFRTRKSNKVLDVVKPKRALQHATLPGSHLLTSLL